MKLFLKQNYALVAGIALPLALIAVFFLAGRASVMTVPDPRHDALFVTNYQDRSNNYPYRIGIDDGKLTLRVRPPAEGVKPRNYLEPVIYVFDHKTKRARKIDIDFGNVVDGKVRDPELDALNRGRINSDPVSPDGYVFDRNSRSGRGLFAEMFGSRRHERAYHVLRKGTRAVPVIGVEPIYSARFIGWVSR